MILLATAGERVEVGGKKWGKCWVAYWEVFSWRKLLGSELFEIPVSEIPCKKFSFNSFLVSLFFSPQISQIIVPSFYFFFCVEEHIQPR